MYSRHAAQFDRLIDACMPADQVAILRDIFTNPKATLEHNGAITLKGSLVAPSIQSSRWAVAQHNWDYGSGGASPSQGGGMASVLCREATDFRGNGTTDNTDITIYLPVTPGDDPNVVEGVVIAFFEMNDGTFMAPGYGDDQIGTVRYDINGNATSPKGWGVMDGSDNSKAKGGSALDIATNKRFLRQWASVGDNTSTGGAETDSVTVGSHSGGSVDSAVAIANHGSGTSGATSGDFPHHTHEVDNSATVAAGSGTPQEVASLNHTGNMVLTPTPDAHTHTTPALSHTVTGSSALSHGAVSVDTVPPFIYVACLERLNNSRTGLGL